MGFIRHEASLFQNNLKTLSVFSKRNLNIAIPLYGSQNQFESIPQNNQHVITISIICPWKWEDHNVTNKFQANDFG